MSKKILAVLLVFGMLVGMLTACKNSNEPANTNDPTSNPVSTPDSTVTPEPAKELTAKEVVEKACEDEEAFLKELMPLLCNTKVLGFTTDALNGIALEVNEDGKLYFSVAGGAYLLDVNEVKGKFQTSVFGTKGENILGLDDETEQKLLEIFDKFEEMKEKKDVEQTAEQTEELKALIEAVKKLTCEMTHEDNEYKFKVEANKKQFREIVGEVSKLIEKASETLKSAEDVSLYESEDGFGVDVQESDNEYQEKSILESFDETFADKADTDTLATALMTVEEKDGKLYFKDASFEMVIKYNGEYALEKVEFTAEHTDGVKYVLKYCLLAPDAEGKLELDDEPTSFTFYYSKKDGFYFSYVNEGEEYISITSNPNDKTFVVATSVGTYDEETGNINYKMEPALEGTYSYTAGQRLVLTVEFPSDVPVLVDFFISAASDTDYSAALNLLTASSEQLQPLFDFVGGLFGTEYDDVPYDDESEYTYFDNTEV